MQKQKTSMKRRDYLNLQKKIQTRRDILRAARELFVRDGYHQTSPDSISRLAGVAHGTFYTYFEDKLDCFLAFTDEALYEIYLVNLWHAPETKRPGSILRAMLRSTFEYSLTNPGVVRAVMVDLGVLLPRENRPKKKTPYLGGSWIPMIMEWQRLGEADPDIDPKAFAYLVTGAIKQGDALVTRNPECLEDIAENFSLFLTRALGPASSVSAAPLLRKNVMNDQPSLSYILSV